MSEAFVCDAIRTPVGRYGGALSSVWADDLAAHPIRVLIERNGIDAAAIDDVVLGCDNQADEDDRNVARMAALLAGPPETVGGATINRLRASGLDTVGYATRAIRSGDAELMIASGVESMSRAPFVMPKAETAFSRGNAVALGRPLGMSGARPFQALVHQLEASSGQRGLATLCVGVGQGVSLAVDRV